MMSVFEPLSTCSNLERFTVHVKIIFLLCLTWLSFVELNVSVHLLTLYFVPKTVSLSGNSRQIAIDTQPFDFYSLTLNNMSSRDTHCPFSK